MGVSVCQWDRWWDEQINGEGRTGKCSGRFTHYFTVFLRVHGTKDPCWPGADAAKPQISQQQRMIDDADKIAVRAEGTTNGPILKTYRRGPARAHIVHIADCTTRMRYRSRARQLPMAAHVRTRLLKLRDSST